MQSRQQLVLRALAELGAAPAGQAPAAEDAKTVDDEVEPMFANLASREIFQWGDPDQIDDEAFVPLAKWLANSVAMAFGVAPDENLRLLQEQSLRQIQPIIRSGQPLTVDYF